MTSSGFLGAGARRGVSGLGGKCCCVARSLCCSEVSAPAHVAWHYKAGLGQAAQLRASLSWELERRSKAPATAEKQRSGKTWKLPSHTAPRGESETGVRGKFCQRSVVFLALLLGMLFLFLLCRERHAAASTSGWSLSVFLARDTVWKAGALWVSSTSLGNALLLFLPSQAPPFDLESKDLFCQRRQH